LFLSISAIFLYASIACSYSFYIDKRWRYFVRALTLSGLFPKIFYMTPVLYHNSPVFCSIFPYCPGQTQIADRWRQLFQNSRSLFCNSLFLTLQHLSYTALMLPRFLTAIFRLAYSEQQFYFFMIDNYSSYTSPYRNNIPCVLRNLYSYL
jgi:hypothetical protein